MRPKHRERLRALAPFVVPEPGSPERAAFDDAVGKLVPPARAAAFVKEQSKKTIALTSAQATNGAGLPADATLREFLSEYNGRVIRHGLGSLPSSFNAFEAFMVYLPGLVCFRLLPERDHQFSWAHFIDYVTSTGPELDIPRALEAMPEGTVLNYSNVDDPADLLFAGASGLGFGPLAFSVVRHGSEVTVVFTGGQEADLESESRNAVEALEKTGPLYRPYLDKIDAPTEAVALASKKPLWRTLAASRLDLDVRTEDRRYVLLDMGDAYLVKTDDVAVLLDRHGNFIDDHARRVAETAPEQLVPYSGLFDLCATALHLPGYFEEHEESVIAERRATSYRQQIKKASASLLKRWIPAGERIAFRTVECLVPEESSLHVPERTFAAPDFRVETSGYWKKLDAEQIGADRNGNPEPGRTWVTKRLSWLEGSPEGGMLDSASSVEPSGPDPGWIYVMRTAMHPPDVFKVGLTRRHPDTRAREFSGTNAPDDFLVVHQWPSGDCASTERQIHERLAHARIRDDREFFQLPLRELVDIVNEVLAAETD